ncbi:16S rRNA (cytosine1402-N4)-methyltransferase [Antricoccus suffuscus]|uniref:Ribosomal RNA small subunit methyltransferase H n=1 Tax=Antricoccus suffuscus TaxID=1629062 RepID=A0A2T0ZYS9_9ACTN|nr:16S rRNA (cytosine(1402)-N(4))-methyltransferase RsmH [Antricoccus suffuscus]PRZ41407.1 16S rRNA (cytosine1402-N4)-methyltransferase [Antricoccus suffuscus]
MEREDQHVPVLLDRVLTLLAPPLDREGAIVVDATLGLGGHSEAILQAHPGAQLVGLDRDTDALQYSERRLAPYLDRVHLVHAVYDELGDALDDLGFTTVQGILFDLGVSSMQLDRADRGFAYAQDAPLDMRMDQTRGISAQDIIDSYSVEELRRVIGTYGEEKFAGRVAQAIVRRRDQGPLTSSAELAELVRSAIPAATRKTGGHPAKRTFQALRIEVNAEMSVLERAIPAALDRLEVGGRMVVLSYHSLEDRIVKRVITDRTTDKTPIDLPVMLDSHQPQLRSLVRGAEKATDTEINDNPRSASVRLRAVERVREAA